MKRSTTDARATDSSATSGDDTVRLLAVIGTAFAHRPAPDDLHGQPAWRVAMDSDLVDAESFRGLDRSTMTCAHLRRHHCGLMMMTPAAFRHFLPLVLVAGIEERAFDLLAWDAVLGELDRSPRADYWNEHFETRWSGLSPRELEAVQAWVLWLVERDPDAYPNNAYERAFDTLSLLIDRAG